jgi:hypothetical protein
VGSNITLKAAISNALLSTLWTRGRHPGLTVCVSIYNAYVKTKPDDSGVSQAARLCPNKSTDKHLIGHSRRSLEEKQTEGKRKPHTTANAKAAGHRPPRENWRPMADG